MSSREFLVLIGGLPDESEYKRYRAGAKYGVREWTPSEHRQARLVREAVLQRYQMFPTEELPDMNRLYSPFDLAAQSEIADATAAVTDDAYDQNEAELHATHSSGRG
ncbi:Uncharacterised protein [Mycobacteroides abscessus subsp. abscessus]|nr:Uncharacterised protein [Mycobacteroides abscessus subsp. abscessus]SKU57641.1 Uncharacterised protein [Mycobacteroides abscessus subsp. abscessus]